MKQMTISVFGFDSYLGFTLAWIHNQPNRGHGIRSKLAQAINKQNVFISQVLHGDQELSLSQAKRLAEFMGLHGEQLDYYLLLVQIARSDSKEIRDYYRAQAEKLKLESLELHKKSSLVPIQEDIQEQYYSSWHYAAVRLCTSVQSLQSIPQIANYLGISEQRTSEVLEFLINAGMVRKEMDRYQISSSNFYLKRDSTQIQRHHFNWRYRCIEALSREQPHELHYSTAVVLARSDILKIKEILVGAIEQTRTVTEKSKNEEVYFVGVDFFKV